MRKPGIDSSLSSVPPVWPSPRPLIFPNGTPQAATIGADGERRLVADAAGRVLVDDLAAERAPRSIVSPLRIIASVSANVSRVESPRK